VGFDRLPGAGRRDRNAKRAKPSRGGKYEYAAARGLSH